jgi:tetratricopeptide (TPR) repeat protein
MAKKKHRKQPACRISKPASRISQPASRISNPASRIMHPRKIILVAALVIIGVFISVFLIKKNSNQAPAILSQIDFSETEPQVVEKIKSLQKQVSDNPESAAAWGKLAMNLDIHDFKSESISCYKQAATLDPNDFRWPYYAAVVLDEIGSPEALQFYEQSQALKSDYTATHLRYGEALFHSKRLDEASKEFNAALTAEKNSAHAYLGLARIALTSGNYEEARTNLEKALQSNPNFGEVHGLLSEVYRRLNRPDDANRELGISQQLPKKKPLQDKLELELLNEGVSSYWYDLRGRAYLDQGYYEDAIRELKLAVQYSKSDPRLITTLGIAYLQAKKYPEATEQFRASLARNPNSVNTMNNLASALFEMGKIDEAIQLLNKAIQQQPDFAGSYDHLGRLLLRSGKRAEAFQAYQRAWQKFPDDSTLALQLAWMHATSSEASIRDPQKAFQLADGICKKTNYSDVQSLYVLAAAYAEVGDFAGAIKVAQRAHQIAMRSGQVQIADQIQSHLKSYEAGQPIRE